MTPTYRSWARMIQRCYNPKTENYKDYGGRGIQVYEPWRTFSNFVADMGERPTGTTLDRKSNSDHYGPNNCQWSTPQTQANNRRSSVFLKFAGKEQTQAQWARELGIKQGTLWARLKTMPLELALKEYKY